MASNAILSNPLVLLNGESYSIVPNSLSVKIGRGTKSMKTEAAGTVLNAVYSDNLEDAVSEVTFSLYTTTENINNLEVVRDAANANTLELVLTSVDGDSLNLTMTNAAITNEPEINFKSEGQTQYIFQGDQLA